MKRIIQISTIPADRFDPSTLFALTADGKVYVRGVNRNAWTEIEGIPDDQPDNQKIPNIPEPGVDKTASFENPPTPSSSIMPDDDCPF